MKRVVNIRFSWEDGAPTSDGPSYILTTTIGAVPVSGEIQLFSDKRGFYNSIENSIVFTRDLSVAKKRVENLIVSVLTSA